MPRVPAVTAAVAGAPPGAVWAGDVHGVAVRSRLPCFGLAPGAAGRGDSTGRDADRAVTIAVGPVPPRLAAATYDRVCVQAAPGELLVHVPGTGRYLARGGAEVTVSPSPGCDPAHLRLHLERAIWAGVLQQRGRLVLRACAVGVDGEAVLLAGPSGGGASTLAAALHLRHGFEIVADGPCPVDVDPAGGGPGWHPPAVVAPPGPDLLLWRHALHRLGIVVPAAAAVHADIDKHRVVLAGGRRRPGAWPVRAVYLLGTHDDHGDPAPELMPARRGDRVVALQAAVYRQQQAIALDPSRAGCFDALVTLAAQTPVTRVRRRWFPWAVEALADAVAADLALPLDSARTRAERRSPPGHPPAPGAGASRRAGTGRSGTPP